VNPPEAGANPVGGPTLTEADARAALKRMKDTKGLATPACIAHIQSFGVDAISKLPAANYAEFIRQADEKIAAHLATAK
jgi:pullulanase/glycogen debranching enzyme